MSAQRGGPARRRERYVFVGQADSYDVLILGGGAKARCARDFDWLTLGPRPRFGLRHVRRGFHRDVVAVVAVLKRDQYRLAPPCRLDSTCDSALSR